MFIYYKAYIELQLITGVTLYGNYKLRGVLYPKTCESGLVNKNSNSDPLTISRRRHAYDRTQASIQVAERHTEWGHYCNNCSTTPIFVLTTGASDSPGDAVTCTPLRAMGSE